MERHELAHELGISEDFSYSVVSALYDHRILKLAHTLSGLIGSEKVQPCIWQRITVQF